MAVDRSIKDYIYGVERDLDGLERGRLKEEE
jgi:hypothetical protein